MMFLTYYIAKNMTDMGNSCFWLAEI